MSPQTLSDYARRFSRVPNRLTITTGDGTIVKLTRRKQCGIGTDAVTWVYASEHGDIQVGLSVRFSKEIDASQHLTRFVGIVSHNGIVPPEVGAELASVFMPEMPAEMRWTPFGDEGSEDWPYPCLVTCNSRMSEAVAGRTTVPCLN